MRLAWNTVNFKLRLITPKWFSKTSFILNLRKNKTMKKNDVMDLISNQILTLFNLFGVFTSIHLLILIVWVCNLSYFKFCPSIIKLSVFVLGSFFLQKKFNKKFRSTNCWWSWKSCLGWSHINWSGLRPSNISWHICPD